MIAHEEHESPGRDDYSPGTLTRNTYDADINARHIEEILRLDILTKLV